MPHVPSQNFGLQERLNRHHMEVHAEACLYGCHKKERSHSEACKIRLSKCSRPVRTKKAWGCSCCIQCFGFLEEWGYHVRNHPVQNEKVQGWSFSTMVWSLLKQPYLSEYMVWEHWKRCNWSTLSREASHFLRFALERREVPTDVRAHPGYSNPLAKYAFNLGMTGKAYPHKTTGTTTGMTKSNPSQSSSPFSHIINSSTAPHYGSAWTQALNPKLAEHC